MKWIAAAVTINSQDVDLACDLVADIFYSLKLKGVVVEDGRLDETQDWGEVAVLPSTTPGVTGYFADTTKAAEKCQTLEAALEGLNSSAGIATQVTYSRLDETDWAEAWKEHFWPEKISDTLVVKPSWRDYEAGPDEIVIEIDPGMAFGTGTHPTTSLCLQLLEEHLSPGDNFLDVGTGSGILMIGAAKLGAHELWGVDNDEVATKVARTNLEANGIQSFCLHTGNLVDQVDRSFRVVAANILAEVIVELLPAVRTVLAPDGLFISSGIIASKKQMVLDGLAAHGLTVVEVREKEEWVAIVAQRAEV